MTGATTAMLLAAAVVLAARVADGRQQAVARPNVLFLAVDDQNDWVGVMGGHPQAATPNIDRLARRGVLFTSAYTAAPACNPSRTAVMTGIRPSTSGMYFNPQQWREVLPDAVIIPEQFRRHGYTAMGGGKILHGNQLDPDSWDEYFPSKAQARPDDPLPDARPANGIPGAGNFDWGGLDVPDGAMGDAQVADWAIAQLGRRHEQPFFLAVGMYRPHLPWYVPRRYFDMFPLDRIELPEVLENDLDDIPPIGRRMARLVTNGQIPTRDPDPSRSDHARVVEHGQWAHAVQGYLASMAFADAQIGRILDALDASPHAENTIVVLWTDHGWNLGEKEHWRKFALWEDTTRTPLIIAGPGVGNAGTTSARPVSLLDLYPTLVELCGLSRPDGLEGASLVPLLQDPGAAWNHAAVTTHGRNNHAVRTDRWRYIRYSDGTEELYDHAADPHEWHNLATRPEHAATRERLARWLPAVNAPQASGGSVEIQGPGRVP